MSRVALVSGAARGIGAATVTLLAAQGWHVVAIDVCADDPALPYRLGTKAELESVAAAVPGRIVPAVADVRDRSALERIVADTEQSWGGVDAAIACAGVIAGGVPQHEVPTDAERAVLDVNLSGVLNLVRAAVPAMQRRPAPRDGRIVAVASAAATRGLPMLAAYCAAKAGVTGAVRALAAELADSGITVNAVSPGSTDTPILVQSAALYDLEHHEEFAAQLPIGRLVQAAEVAAVIAFLVGLDAGAITGAVVPVDGGMAL
jgi:SDR family mycofactocin-dependent oxidoreductase